MKPYGDEVFEIISGLDPMIDRLSPRIHARSAGRFLEEAVELALAFGLSPKDIMGHVADALHNECRKAGVYPSELRPAFDHNERVKEIADVRILIDYLSFLAEISELHWTFAADAKMASLRQAAATGQLKVVNGVFYRRASRE